MTLRLLNFDGFHARQIRSRDDDVRPGSGGERPNPDSDLLELVKALARATAREDHRRFTGREEAARDGGSKK
jgi:hypothetical protein